MLTQLTYLELYGNPLRGEIPSQMGRLTNLVRWINAWAEFTYVPSEIGLMTSLNELLFLHAFEQPFRSVTIPTEVGNLGNLTSIYFGDNPRLTGSIPTTIGGNSKLTSLTMLRNELQGTLPSELGLISDLKVSTQ